MTTPKEEGLKPCEHCGKQPVRFGLADAYRCEPCMKNSGWMSKKDWNHRLATEEQRLRELLQELWDWKESDLVDGWFSMAYAHGSRVTYEYSVKIEDMNARIKAALSNAPAPQIICTCREGSSLPEGQHFVGCGLYKFPVPESERHTQ